MNYWSAQWSLLEQGRPYAAIIDNDFHNLQFWTDVTLTQIEEYTVVCIKHGLVDNAVSFSSDSGVTMEGFSITMQCVVDICSNNGTYCGNGTCLYSNYGLECHCEKGFKNKDQNPALPCQEINECQDVDCGQGYCRDEINSFST